jgi:hypothetical protein
VAPRNALNLYDFDIISSPKFLRKLWNYMIWYSYFTMVKENLIWNLRNLW